MHISQLIDREAAAFRDPSQIRITSRVAIDLKVMADETELARVFANLFENARRYGRSADTGIAEVEVSYARSGPWVLVSVRDRVHLAEVMRALRRAPPVLKVSRIKP